MKILILSILTLSVVIVKSQPKNADQSRIIDELVSIQDGDDDYEQVYENLMQVLSHPMDINTVTAEELRQYFILKETQIIDLVKYRDENGPFLSLYELQSVPSFDMETINKILPFIKLVDAGNRIDRSLLDHILHDGSQYLITRWERTLETKDGYSNTEDPKQKYRGSPDKFYLRLRSSKPGKFSVGLTTENDAGENFSWQPRARKFGTDYLSVHAQLLNRGKIKNLIVGDYQAQFGQGLVFGGAFGLGKGAETISTTRRSNIGFIPHTSAGEAGFFRGVATTISPVKNIYFSMMYSDVSRDGTLSNDPDGNILIKSLQYSGYHRNSNEQQNRGAIRERVTGSALAYQKRVFSGGLIAQHIQYDHPWVRDTSVYYQFAFRGSENFNISAQVSASIYNATFFGEAAKSLRWGIAIVAGTLISLDPKFDVALVYRKFDRNYFPFYANPFSESSQPTNESGFYIGWKYRWNRRYQLAGYTDLFTFPWISFRRYQPSTGYEWLLRITYQPARKISMFAQAREESKMRNSSDPGTNYAVVNGLKRNFWIAFNYATENNFTFKTRFQYSTFQIDSVSSDGMVLLQTVSYSFRRWQFTGSYAIFDTDNFDNRQYVYENDVQLAFTLPAYDGVGVRNYLIIEYKISKTLTVWLRYARTQYQNQENIGSGTEMIHGNTRNDVKFQAMLKF